MSLLTAMLKTKQAEYLSGEGMRRLQKRRLNRLAAYARAHSPYYEALYRDAGDDVTLSDLPTTNKVEMMAHFDHFVTDPAITMERIEAFTADLANLGHRIDGKYLVFKTSGSTGNPAVVLYDKGTIDVSSAVAAWRTFARKEDLKRFLQNGKRTAGVFADEGFYLACGMSKYLQLQRPKERNKINVDVNRPETEIIGALNDFQPSMLSGYPSNLALLAGFDELRIKPDVVITGGELLTDEIRERLERKFGCYVQTHYSCTEAGEIACQCREGHLHINEDWVIVEPVDRENRPVPCGVQSDKALITNLSNYFQPFIRYELTDRITVHDEPCPCGKKSRWLEIEGRTDDILSFSGGVRIAPMSFYKILEEVEGVSRFQLIQRETDRLELRLVAADIGAAFSKAEAALTAFLRSKSVTGVQIVLSEEPPQANRVSGKFKHVYREQG